MILRELSAKSDRPAERRRYLTASGLRCRGRSVPYSRCSVLQISAGLGEGFQLVRRHEYDRLGQRQQDARVCPVLAQNCGNIEKPAISSSCPRTLGWHGYDPARSRLPPLVAFSKPSVTRARACRIPTSGDRPPPTSVPFADRLLWVWLYRVRPQVLETLLLVKPATVVQWHRKGFRFYWRWRSRCPLRPKDERRNTRPNPSNEPRQPAPGAHLASTANCSSSASTSVRLPLEGICLGVRRLPPRLGAAFCGTI
jgi:hypothetical protein